MVEFVVKVCSSVHRKLCHSLQLQPQSNQKPRISQGNSGDFPKELLADGVTDLQLDVYTTRSDKGL